MDLLRAKEELKQRLDIAEVVGQVMELRPHGKNLIGLCPFHQEKTPSFTVNRERQFFHCFGCKAGGDVITFWMRYQKMGFLEAIEDLGSRYGIDLSISRDDAFSPVKGILEVNRVSMEFFVTALRAPKTGKDARDYLAKRALTKDIVEEFQLGYAPEGWETLSRHLKKKGLLEEGMRAGLISEGRENPYDRFRDRIMFPLKGPKGEVLGFGGRIIRPSQKEPKYLNTPETSVFQKRRYLYGLYQGLHHIRSASSAFIVEGYMDLLSLRSYGIGNCVATLGTALTRDHLKALRPHAQVMILLFDGDQAGRTAVLRVLPMFLNEGLNPKVILLPEGHDPDTFLREKGYVEFEGLVKGARDIIDFYTDTLLKEVPDRDKQIISVRDFLKVVQEITSPILQGECLRKVSDNLRLNYDLLLKELEVMKNNLAEKKDDIIGKIYEGKSMECLKDQEALNLFFYNPHFLKEIEPEEFVTLNLSNNTIKIMKKLKEHIIESEGLDLDALIGACEEDEASMLREVMLTPPIFKGKELQKTIEALKIRIKSNMISIKINEAKSKGNLELLSSLLKQKAEIINQLSQTL